jgi:hypothetical protein
MALSEGINFLSLLRYDVLFSFVLVLLILRVRAVWSWNKRVRTGLWIGYGFVVLGIIALVALYLGFDLGKCLSSQPP